MTPGILRISADEYHRDPAPEPSLSSTLARILVTQSPRHAWDKSPRLNPQWAPEESEAFDVGRAAHRAVLGAGSDYAVIPDDILASNGAASTKAAKAFIEDARAAGLTPIKADVEAQVLRIADNVRATLHAVGMSIDPARSELVAMAQIDGVWCRAMIDNAPVGKPYLVDIKTTTDASPDAVIKAVESYGYDHQAAHYIDTWEAATGERRVMRFVFVEKKPPHEVSIVQLHDDPEDDADWMLNANSKAREARRIWRECLDANHWPGYPRRVAIIGARGFYRQRWADRAVGLPITPDKPSRAALEAARAAQAPEGWSNV